MRGPMDIPRQQVPSPENGRKIEALISAFHLERPISALPRPLRFAVCHNRYGRIRRLARLQHSFDDRRSLIEPERLNTIFVHIPKAAGVSVTESLFSSHGASHVPLYLYLALYGSRRFDRMFKFTFVRHPLDRLISAFQFLKAGGMTHTDRDWAAEHLAPYETVEAFICEGLMQPHIRTWVHFFPQVYYLRDPRTGRVGIDYLGRFETLNKDFDHIARRLGVSAQLKHVNKTSRREVTVSAEAKQVIEAVYKDDFDILGY